MLIESFVLIIFISVYWGMAAGKLPWLVIDRAGIALLGAFLLLVTGITPLTDLPHIIELPTLLMLFALMIVGAHFAVAGSFNSLAYRLGQQVNQPKRLLVGVIAASGILSMVLVNDIIVFAFAPVLCMALSQQSRDPRPYLLALAASANAGSAASLIGNPQNILIGQIGQLSFADYFLLTIVPVLLTLLIIYFVISYLWKSHFQPLNTSVIETKLVPVNRVLLIKSVLATFALVILLLIFPIYRLEIVLAVVSFLLISRSVRTPSLLKEVDWSLLLLIAGLFVVTSAFSQLPLTHHAIQQLEDLGWLPNKLSVLIPFSVIASNTIGNVPAVLMLLSVSENLSTVTLQGLALFSTLAGNLLLTGSLANIIVAERAASQGIRLGFMDFLRVGIPITLFSILIAGCWFYAFTNITW